MTTKSRTTSRRISESRQKRKESLRQRRRQQRLEDRKTRERRKKLEKKFSRNKKKTRRKPSPKILENAKPTYLKTLRDIITRKTIRPVTLV